MCTYCPKINRPLFIASLSRWPDVGAVQCGRYCSRGILQSQHAQIAGSRFGELSVDV